MRSISKRKYRVKTKRMMEKLQITRCRRKIKKMMTTIKLQPEKVMQSTIGPEKIKTLSILKNTMTTMPQTLKMQIESMTKRNAPEVMSDKNKLITKVYTKKTMETILPMGAVEVQVISMGPTLKRNSIFKLVRNNNRVLCMALNF